MKRIVYILALLLGLQGCEKETFDYQVYQPQASDIDSVGFFTGSPTLIADGQASLQFVLEAYRRVEIKNKAGVTKDTMMFVDYKALPAEEVKVFVDGKLIEGTVFSTADLSKTTVSCYAQVGNVKSKTKEVLIRQPKNVGAMRYVDVVFHILEMNPTDYLYDPLTYQEVTPKMLNDGIAYANEIFNNKVGKDPNGGSANIEFRLAKTNATGAALTIPGVNKIVYNESWKPAGTLHTTTYKVTDFINKINATTTYQWNKDKFLNIYVIPSSPNNSVGSFRAGYQIVLAGQTPIQGIGKIVQSEAEVPNNLFYETYGLGIHRTAFFPDPSNRLELASYFATYYATYPTHSVGTTVDDFVSDTRKYLTGSTQTINSLAGLLKMGIDGEKFLANNAMDDVRNASLRNSFTQGQVERIRKVMERSPVRKAWTLQ